LEADEKVKVYDRGVQMLSVSRLPAARQLPPAIWAPNIEQIEA